MRELQLWHARNGRSRAHDRQRPRCAGRSQSPASDFEAQRPNQRWATDITYVWTSHSWMYLAVVHGPVLASCRRDGRWRRIFEPSLRSTPYAWRSGAACPNLDSSITRTAACSMRRTPTKTCFIDTASWLDECKGRLLGQRRVESFFSRIKTELLHRQLANRTPQGRGRSLHRGLVQSHTAFTLRLATSALTNSNRGIS